MNPNASSVQVSREEMARREIGRTGITPGLARGFVLVFLALLFAVPTGQHAAEIRAGRAKTGAWAWPPCYDIFRRVAAVPAAWRAAAGPPVRRLFRVNSILLRDLHEYEDTLEESSWLTRVALPPAQYALLRWFGVGNEKVYRGLDGWLFYRPEIEYLSGPGFLEEKQLRRRAASGSEWQTAPQPDPLQATLDFHALLRARGIELVVMPTPVKPSIHPERLTRAFAGQPAPLQNSSYAAFLDILRQNGVHVFDPAGLLKEAALREGRPQYLAADTHWRPEAMERVAEQLAGVIAGLPDWPGGPRLEYRREALDLSNRGDLALMLTLPERVRPAPESVTIHPVFTARQELWQPDTAAAVLLLGDSFCNIYSLPAMGWGAGAGLAEQLGYYLGAPVDRLVRNDNGAHATRRLLSRELALGRDRLAGKRVVVWQFSSRELVLGDWQLMNLALGAARPARFIHVPPGRTWQVEAQVAEVSPVPRPGSVPYKDHILSARLNDVTGIPDGPADGAEVLAYLWSMKDNQLQPAAYLRAGQTVRLRLSAWSDVAGSLEAINRSEPTDPAVQLEEPCWGEMID